MDRSATAGRAGAVAFIQKVVTQRDLLQYGIKGMRWGFRRTPAQLAADKAGENSAAPDGDGKSTAKPSGGSPNPKAIKDLDNKELQELVNRLNLEKQYRQLTEKPKKPTAKDFIKDLLVDIGKTELSRVVKTGGRIQVEKMLGKQGNVTVKEIAEQLAKQRKKAK